MRSLQLRGWPFVRATKHRGIAVTMIVLIGLPAMLAAQTGSTPPPSAVKADTQRVLPGPPIRRIESAQAVSVVPLGSISQVREVSGGRVLVDDGSRRRLLMLDSTLTQVTVVLDSLSEIREAYGTGSGSLIPAQGHRSLFMDPQALAILVLDGNGKIEKVRSVPLSRDVGAITSFGYGLPGVDTRDRLVYRIGATPARPPAPTTPGAPIVWPIPDSAFVIGVSLETRKIDTLGVVRIPGFLTSTRLEPEGYYSVNYINHPLPLVDGWALMSDGSVAFVRGLDYRVEFRAPDGTVTSSEKLPFPWVQLTEADKVRFADSLNKKAAVDAQSEFISLVIAWSNSLNKPYPPALDVPFGYALPPGLPKDWILPKGVTFPANYLAACPPGVRAGGSGTQSAPPCARSRLVDAYGPGYAPPAPTYRAPTRIKPEDLPDYKPPIGQGAVRADADGNLWVRTIPMRPTPGGQVFDIISRQGVMVDRIQIPQGYQLAGFGPGRVVYLSNRDATGARLSRVRLK